MNNLLTAVEDVLDAYDPTTHYDPLALEAAVCNLKKQYDWYKKEREALQSRFGGCRTPLVMAEVALHYAYEIVREIIFDVEEEE